MDIRKNKRGIKIKRCCASCKHKEIDDDGNRYCTLGLKDHTACRKWRMTVALRNCGTPYGVIKNKAYLRYVLDIRDREINSSCYQYQGELRDIEEIRKEYKHSINLNF